MQPQKIVRPQAKGMVTIPSEFREKLGINENTLLEAQLTKKGVLFVKIDLAKKESFYTDKEIENWVKEDRLDPKVAKKIQGLLSK